ncbi:zeta toxin family protein [Candidatus Saccharibacteria bacterium]|nr:zeta toxin family protein [Candidatus Saccharibacteria bacterium]
MPESNRALEKIISYMKAHWPSEVKPEWQVGLAEYPKILRKVINDFTLAATKNRRLIRIAGVSGSGKTTQILPAVEAYCEKNNFEPILLAARRFVEYHPHYEEIKDFYGVENLRKNTDEFSTIMLFLTLSELIENGYDIVLDVTLLDPEMESILLNLLTKGNYKTLILMLAVSPTVTELFLQGRAWRHTKETEKEFIRATEKALKFYADSAPDLHIILWSVYDKPPVYDGPIKNSLGIFADYSAREELPKKDDDARRDAKIKYLTTDSDLFLEN